MCADATTPTEPTDPFRDWPAAAGYVGETLDPRLIENHASAILARALNIGRVVAFLGAGVSMAYGRISWRGLVEAEYQRVTRAYDRRKLEHGGSRRAEDAHLERLYEAVRELDPVRDDVHPDRYPMVFQVCAQLDEALRAAVPPKDGDLPLTRRAMALLLDELGHAEQILQEAAGERLKSDPSPTEADTQAASDKQALQKGVTSFDEARARAAAGFSRAVLEKIGGGVTDPVLKVYADAVLGALPKLPCGDASPAAALLPTHRFLVGVLLRLLPPAPRATQIEGLIAAATATDMAQTPPPRRNAVVRPTRDPLMLLHERLQIQRFVTTNYDHEIERLFQDLQMRGPAEPRGPDGRERGAAAAPATRPAYTSVVFAEARAGDLLAFAVQDRARTSQIMHLHGRAERQGGDITVTETDYQQLYLGASEQRDLIDGGIGLTFGASPVLFLGSNMGEDDIMRPLRQFVSLRTRHGQRTCIALLPGKFGPAQCLEEKIALLGRFGVYAIHFGDAAVLERPGAGVEAAGDKLQLRLNEHAFWLPWVFELVKQIRALLKEIIAEADPGTPPAAASPVPPSRQPGGEAWTKRLQALEDVLAPAAGKPSPLLWANAAMRADRACSPLAQYSFVRDGLLATPTMIEGITCSSPDGLDVGLEVALVNLAMAFVRDPGTGAVARQAMAHRAALQGVLDSLMSVFTAARLLRVRWEWDAWRADWFQLPTAREARPTTRLELAAAPDGVPVVKGFRLIDSHALDLPDLAERAAHPKFGRFHADAGSQSVEDLLLSLDGADARRFQAARGRRLLYVAGRRGVGRGNFFSALQYFPQTPANNRSADGTPAETTPAGGTLARLLQAMGGTRGMRWRAAVFLNMSFAHEVYNGIDRVVRLLLELLRESAPSEARERQWETIRRDRIERLRFVLAQWRDCHLRSERVLVAINAVDVLFDRGGLPKNGEAKRLFEILFDERFADVPLDLILVSHEERLPLPLDAARRMLLPPQLSRLSGTARQAVSDRARYERIAVQRRPVELLRQRGEPRTMALYFLQEERISLLVARHFPRVALLLARQSLLGEVSAGGTPDYPPIFLGEQAALHLRRAFAGILHSDKPDRMAAHRPDGPAPARYFVPLAVALLAMVLEQGGGAPSPPDPSPPADQGLAIIVTTLSAHFAQAGTTRPTDGRELTTLELMAASAADWLQTEDGAKATGGCTLSADELHRTAQHFDELCARIHGFTANNRFTATLMLAAAYEITADLTWQQRRPPGSASWPSMVERGPVDSACQRLARFFDRVGRELKGVAEAHRSMVIIAQVMRMLQRHHQRDASLPIGLHLVRRPPSTQPAGASAALIWAGPQTATVRRASPEMADLVDEIIWHLAVIGAPTDLFVLVRCPRIRAAATRLFQAFNPPGSAKTPLPPREPAESDIRKMVAEMLALCVNRCLIVALKPHAADDWLDHHPPPRAQPDPAFPARYTLHRTMQRYVFLTLGAPDVETGEVDRFTVTMFASQPDSIPKVSPEAEQGIRQLVKSLVGYPEVATLRDSGHAYAQESPEMKTRMLRAGLGVVRSIYSMGVLARSEPPAGASASGLGSLEDHRLIIRWMLRCAAQLNEPPGQASRREAPFYADELVWLYNECGLLSLAQGRLVDAHSLFDQALEVARRDLEPEVMRPLSLRIMLNRAVVDIERGHADAARMHLQAIAALDDTVEQAVPPLVASGYLGLIEHLAGNTDIAIVHYLRAIDGLQALNRSRGAALFSKHLADLHRSTLPSRHEEAEKFLDQALNLAQEGRHEDIRHLALLSRVRFRIDVSGSGDAATARMQAIHGDLDTVERYARGTGMVRLNCEALLLRARLLLQQGETRQASGMAIQGLELASAHGLRIRKMSALLLLAQICVARRLDATARPLLLQATRLARSAKCHLALTDIQAIESQLSKG